MQRLLLLRAAVERLLKAHQATTFSTLASDRTLNPSLQKYIALNHSRESRRCCDTLILNEHMDHRTNYL